MYNVNQFPIGVPNMPGGQTTTGGNDSMAMLGTVMSSFLSMLNQMNPSSQTGSADMFTTLSNPVSGSPTSTTDLLKQLIQSSPSPWDAFETASNAPLPLPSDALNQMVQQVETYQAQAPKAQQTIVSTMKTIQALFEQGAELEPESDEALKLQAQVAALSLKNTTLDLTLNYQTFDQQETNKDLAFIQQAQQEIVNLGGPAQPQTRLDQLILNSYQRSQLRQQLVKTVEAQATQSADSPEFKALLAKVTQADKRYKTLEDERFNLETQLFADLQGNLPTSALPYPTYATEGDLERQFLNNTAMAGYYDTQLQGQFITQAKSALTHVSQALVTLAQNESPNSPTYQALDHRYQAIQALVQSLDQNLEAVQQKSQHWQQAINNSLSQEQRIEQFEQDAAVAQLAAISLGHARVMQGKVVLQSVTGALNTIAANLEPNTPEAQAIEARLQALSQVEQALQAKLTDLSQQFNQTANS